MKEISKEIKTWEEWSEKVKILTRIETLRATRETHDRWIQLFSRGATADAAILGYDQPEIKCVRHGPHGSNKVTEEFDERFGTDFAGWLEESDGAGEVFEAEIVWLTQAELDAAPEYTGP